MKHWFCGVYFQPRKFKVEKGAEITQLICEGIFFLMQTQRKLKFWMTLKRIQEVYVQLERIKIYVKNRKWENVLFT